MMGKGMKIISPITFIDKLVKKNETRPGLRLDGPPAGDPAPRLRLRR